MIVERKLNRLSGYDYSTVGAYFITTNTNNREPVFGEINNGKIELNDCGIIAKQCWDELPKHIDNCVLDEFIVMPDHVHGIVFITGVPVGYRHACTLRDDPADRPYRKLPVIVGSYKSAVSKLIHLAGKTDFKWQKSYHDRIIRDEEEINRIRQYIIDNPTRWGLDDDDYGDGFGG